jgi:predicted kinase
VENAAQTVNVLVISGSMGAGKTTLMGEISDLLTAADIRHAAVELDTLALGHLRAGADELQSQNRSAMWRRFSELGISRLVVSGAIDSDARRKEICGAIPGARLVVCRLRAPLEVMQARVRLREPGMLQEQFVARVQTLDAALDAAALDDFSVDNDERSITDVARDVLRLAQWM